MAKQTPRTTKVLECVECSRLFCKEDVLAGLYRLETMICSYCYARHQQQPHHVSCFGKPTIRLHDGSLLLGYNPKAIECKEWCLDRKVCRRLFMDQDD
jgi:hypothetical protein